MVHYNNLVGNIKVEFGVQFNCVDDDKKVFEKFTKFQPSGDGLMKALRKRKADFNTTLAIVVCADDEKDKCFAFGAAYAGGLG